MKRRCSLPVGFVEISEPERNNNGSGSHMIAAYFLFDEMSACQQLIISPSVAVPIVVVVI